MSSTPAICHISKADVFHCVVLQDRLDEDCLYCTEPIHWNYMTSETEHSVTYKVVDIHGIFCEIIVFKCTESYIRLKNLGKHHSSIIDLSGCFGEQI